MAIIEAAKTSRVTRSIAKTIIEEYQPRFEQLMVAYGERFGYVSGDMDAQLKRLIEASLLSGVDEPELVEMKREHEERRAEYYRKHEELLRTPITAETEQEYTGRIKNGKLYEGACDLPWNQYFIYRDQHPECEPLTPNDLAYLAQYTPCRTNPSDSSGEESSERPQDQEAVPPEPVKSPSAGANRLENLEDKELVQAANQLTGAFRDLTFYADRPQHPKWPKVIEVMGGPVRLREIITTLQAVYDEHCQGNKVKAKADRAETKASIQNGGQHR